ncbi:MAG: LEA type 2 family protein [Trueperaceae bacterium]
MKRYLLLVLPLLLAACAPGVSSVIAPPTFRVVESETALVRLEPAGVGSGSALIHLELEAVNSNPFAMELAGLDGDLYLGGQRVAGSTFEGGLVLPSRGTSRLGLDIEVPVQGAPQLLSQLARLVAGDSVAYRMDATATVNVLGAPQRFPSLTVAQGDLRAPGGLRPPTVRLDPAASEVRFSGLGVQVDVGLVLDNPLPIGYFVRGPQLTLQVDGRSVGRASLPRVPVPAASSSTALLRFDLSLADVGAAMMARLRGGTSGLRLALSGELALEIPGIASLSRPLGEVRGVLP